MFLRVEGGGRLKMTYIMTIGHGLSDCAEKRRANDSCVVTGISLVAIGESPFLPVLTFVLHVLQVQYTNNSPFLLQAYNAAAKDVLTECIMQ